MACFDDSDIALPKLDAFSNKLGWGRLEAFNRMVGDPVSRHVVWYEAGDASGTRSHCALQINEHPIGSKERFVAAVHCLRFRICSGWHAFSCVDCRAAETEAERLYRWLSRDWFASAAGRQAYRMSHPECARYSWKRLSEEGEPYRPTPK
jgi:hypothetical protein